MGNATERRPTKIETTRDKRAEEQMNANELNECRKIGHGTLDRLFSCRWSDTFLTTPQHEGFGRKSLCLNFNCVP